MEAAASMNQSTLASVAPGPPSIRDASRMLKVTATYVLSEEGRKASLLSGGNGHAVQELTIEVAASRLHLVSVDNEGIARLKLRPRYQLHDERGVTRTDAPPTYDAPPDLDELFREAARNHQLEEAFHVARRAARSKRQDAQRERRMRIAQAFLSDRSQRAIVHPAPTEKRCYLSTESGRLLFDADTDEVPARQVPADAHRRFREDLRERKERNRQTRAEQLAVHEKKRRFIAEWIAAHGSADQRARHDARMLPLEEGIEAIADHAFAVLNDKNQYGRNGAARLEAYLRQFAQYHTAIVSASDLAVISRNLTQATSTQWALIGELSRVVPDGTVVLREHSLSWKRDAAAPVLTIVSVLVTVRRGPLWIRREYETESSEHDGLTTMR